MTRKSDQLIVKAGSPEQARWIVEGILENDNYRNLSIDNPIFTFKDSDVAYIVNYSYDMENLKVRRRFLIKEMPFLENGIDVSETYIGINPDIILRQDASGFYYTIKGKGLLSRRESNNQISADLYDRLSLVNKNSPQLHMKSYGIDLDNGYVAQVYVYGGTLTGLSLVEVQFDTEEESINFRIPSWFGKDVTDDSRFLGSSLATMSEDDLSLLKSTHKNYFN